MSKKLMFIMSESESHLRDEVIRIYKKWGFSSENVKYTETWDPSLALGSTSLFGSVSMVHLDLSDANKLKKFVDMLGDKKQKDMFDGEKWFGPGLIITSIHARGAKKIETLITKSGGEIVKKAKPAEMKKTLIKRVNLSKDTKEFLESYTGEDFQILIPIINQIEKMTDKEQYNLSIEDLIVKLPTKPGSVLPWEFINPMLAGNAAETVELYRRSVEGSHVLVTMQFARKKLQLLYRLKLLIISGVRNSKEQAEILNERNSPNIWITSDVAKKLSVETCEYLAKLALETEASLKGYSNSDPDLIFVNFLAATCLAIKNNKAYPLNILEELNV